MNVETVNLLDIFPKPLRRFPTLFDFALLTSFMLPACAPTARAVEVRSGFVDLESSAFWNEYDEPVRMRSIRGDLAQWSMVEASYPDYFSGSFSTSNLDERFGLESQIPDRSPGATDVSLLKRLAHDQLNFYSADSLVFLGVVVASGAALANTQADEQIQKHFQSSVRGATSDEWFEFLHANKELGNGLYSLPLMGAAWVTGEVFEGIGPCNLAGEWGERSIRSFLVGAPPLIVLQRLTGGSRPHESDENSEWHPLRDNNGVSGHAFVSSLPFITMAKLSDKPWQKLVWYSASTVGPLSRVNDNAHYTSQIGMGWALAFLSASAVEQSEAGHSHWRLMPESPSGDSGFSMQWSW